MIILGSLVRSQNNSLGIGKVIDISDTQASVEYFCSVGQRIEKSLPLSSLYQLKLERQTRCYICLESQEAWLIGRIYEWDEEVDKYRIDLPDKKTIAVNEEQVYVRCSLPLADPIETLAMKGQETPYFHDRRFAFVKCLILQRAVSRGMTGLISANIKLYPHQVEVVRRVLEDPIQRYLLADEVGLGKTIQAGAILRQYLLDEPSGRAVVLVPQYLLEQWQQELENKFYISHFPKRLAVLAVEDIHKINPKANIGLLILDEAHHIAAMATSSDATVLQRFETCKNIAHKSDRLLLLSATPVLNHEQDFLAMLHLLDPATYQLDDLAGFRERVVKRQEIGRILLSFKEGANPFVLKTNLKNLRNLFPEDKYLLELADNLENSLQAKASDIVEIVRAIRIHISDTYRLHRRMLRNRRASVEDVIFDRNITLRTEYDLDERSPDIHELIEEWRDVAPDDKQYHHIFLLFFRASGTWLGILKQVIQARLSGVSTAELIQEFGADSVRILTETPKFAGEAEILQSLLRIIEQPSEDGDRLELLNTVILYQLCEPLKLQSLKSNLPKLLAEVQKRIKNPIPGDSLPKIVIFTSFVQTCTEIVRYLSDRFGNGTVVSHQVGQTPSQIEENLNRFKKDPKCFILVCDSSGEEGRNLQFTNYMICFDLPWSPNRLEQRIGRIDRIGRLLKVEFTVFAGVDLPDSLHDAWYRLLKEGFNIFGQSIASLQFYVDEKLPLLAEILFKSGANGLLESIEIIQKEIQQEQVKISEQNALDEIDALDENATQYFQALDDYDARHQEIQQVTEDWISDALRFQPITNPNISALKRYKPTGNTLIPANDLSSNFAGVLEEFGTFNRRVANQQLGAKLYRIGEKFVEALSSYIHWDDRGQAFAMWRVAETWDSGEGEEWYGFRFNYVIETNLTNYKNTTKDKTLQRRVDGLFLPIVESVFIDARYEQMCAIEDETLLNILQRPYNGKGGKYRDYNLAKSRLSILDNFIESSRWQEFCYHARDTSLELLSQRPEFISLCENSAIRAEQKLGKRLDQLRLRLNRLTNQERIYNTVLEQELNNETALNQVIIEGIRHPSIRLDSVGFIIVSGRPPAKSEEDDL
ncbi:helicase [Nostoc sp. 'Peltigera membranacea cyanobiont' 213]|uniref:protein DpdE n=1 Tax=Nostoc sp. 'Peltigera membranacea cyanobiont' 213 TaxID=2014530 RepID=UPI000B9537CE|nr:protein DpdE [Nostoc sp. 'Peltigera membranacea cyanobiont' 213]OYD89900.1 helicase [Nostoc sp. 'Peltigera membranacea cyanobiont' 213]